MAGGNSVSKTRPPKWPLDLTYVNERGEVTKVGIAELEIAAAGLAESTNEPTRKCIGSRDKVRIGNNEAPSYRRRRKELDAARVLAEIRPSREWRRPSLGRVNALARNAPRKDG